MSYTPEQLAAFEAVKTSGICHEVLLKWTRVDIGKTEYIDGEKVNSVEQKVVATCSICGTEYIKAHVKIDLDAI